MVDFLSTSNQDKDLALQSILLTNHPIFIRLGKLTKTDYRVYFTNREEMEIWLKARNWTPGDKLQFAEDSKEEWYHQKFGWIEFKKISSSTMAHSKTTLQVNGMTNGSN
jgi:hypothetical protein